MVVCANMVVCARPLFPHCGVPAHEILAVSCVYIWARTSVSVSVDVGEGVLILLWVYYTGWRPYHYCLCCCFWLLLLPTIVFKTWTSAHGTTLQHTLQHPLQLTLQHSQHNDCFLVNDCSYRIVFRFLIESRYFRRRQQCRCLAGTCVSAPACLPLYIWIVFGLSPDQNWLPPWILDLQSNDGRMKHTQNTLTHTGGEEEEREKDLQLGRNVFGYLFFISIYLIFLCRFFPHSQPREKRFKAHKGCFCVFSFAHELRVILWKEHIYMDLSTRKHRII